MTDYIFTDIDDETLENFTEEHCEQCALLQELGICGGINCCLLNSIVLLVKLGGTGEGVSPTQSHSKFLYTAHIARAKKGGSFKNTEPQLSLLESVSLYTLWSHPMCIYYGQLFLCCWCKELS